MKYLQRYLIHAGLCLLLVCSANGASAQVVVSLSAPSTDVGPTLRFTVSLSSRLMGDDFLTAQILFDNITSNDGSARLLTDFMVSSRTCMTTEAQFGRFPQISLDPLGYQFCIDAGEKDLTIELKLDNSLNTTRTVMVSIFVGGVAGGVGLARDPDRSTLNFIVHPPVRVHSKVFLEGPLQ